MYFLRTLEGPLRGNNQSDNLRGLCVSAHGSQRGTDLDKLKSVLGRELAAGRMLRVIAPRFDASDTLPSVSRIESHAHDANSCLY